MKSAAEILREYGPFPDAEKVNGVTFDGQHVWFASGDTLNALDPVSGESVRSIDVPAHAGTAFDGQHLFQIAEDRIQKIDPQPATCSPPSRRPAAAIRDSPGPKARSGWDSPGPENPPNRSRDGSDSSHHRIQPHRHRCHVGRRRALARHLGRRGKRIAADRSANGRSAGTSRDAGRNWRLGTRIRWRRSVFLRRRKQRKGESHSPAQARHRSRRRRQDRRAASRSVFCLVGIRNARHGPAKARSQGA